MWGLFLATIRLATLKCRLINKLLLCAVYLYGDYVQPRLAPCIKASTEINPPKTARGCPCRGAITMATHAFLSPYRMHNLSMYSWIGWLPFLGALQQNWFSGHEKTMYICFIFVVAVFCFVSSWLFVMVILMYAFIVLVLFSLSSGFWCW